MKKLFSATLAMVGLCGITTETDAQFSVYDKNGNVLYTTQETPAYVDFKYNAPTTGTINGHDWVDLGLSVRWATCNVGATAPQEAGSYIAWGETAAKENYAWSTYKHITEGYSDRNYINKYQIEDNNLGGRWYDYNNNKEFIGDNKTTLDLEDDAAHANWGGGWVMPSSNDFQELRDNCTFVWTTQNGVNGYLISSKTNSNSIFLPAAGYRDGSSHSYEGTYGYYWSSTLYESNSNTGYKMSIESAYIFPRTGDKRYYGYSVRPVCPSAGDTNGHDAVDLGLPSGKRWATCNVGANAPEENGIYVAWGETNAKSEYSWSTYKHLSQGGTKWQDINKYTVNDGQKGAVWYNNQTGTFTGDKKKVLEAADDAATANWGEEWRMPTIEEWEELCNNTTHEWTDNYKDTGVKGCVVTSTINGNSIFLPAAGDRFNSYIYYEGTSGFYWSSSLYQNDSYSGKSLYFDSDNFSPNGIYTRYQGFSVRPVCP